LSPERGRDARAEFEALFADVGLVAASTDLLRRADDLAETHALRGYDAVHLASAAAIADDRTVMVTADRHLRTAARDLGLATANLRGDGPACPIRPRPRPGGLQPGEHCRGVQNTTRVVTLCQSIPPGFVP
jgi:hypothetical protein